MSTRTARGLRHTAQGQPTVVQRPMDRLRRNVHLQPVNPFSTSCRFTRPSPMYLVSSFAYVSSNAIKNMAVHAQNEVFGEGSSRQFGWHTPGTDPTWTFQLPHRKAALSNDLVQSADRFDDSRLLLKCWWCFNPYSISSNYWKLDWWIYIIVELLQNIWTNFVTRQLTHSQITQHFGPAPVVTYIFGHATFGNDCDAPPLWRFEDCFCNPSLLWRQQFTSREPLLSNSNYRRLD